MCGILAVLLSSEDPQELRRKVLSLSKRLRHRGPDWSGVHVYETVIDHNGSQRHVTSILSHERLAIVDMNSGEQPLLSPDNSIALAINGEIYNHRVLRSRFTSSTSSSTYTFSTESDCEVIVPMYRDQREQLVHDLRGMYGFVIATNDGDFFAARDPIGIVPLYYGYDRSGALWIASEMKAIVDECPKVHAFPPGHAYSRDRGLYRYYNPGFLCEIDGEIPIPRQELDLSRLRTALEASVVRRLMCDCPYGVLLSGGLDSSLIASIASRFAKRRVEDGGQSEAWFPRLHSFSVGLIDSPDLAAARKVAAFLNTVHHEFTYTLQQGIDALSDVIFHLETYDVTTIRASTPMYLLSRRIKAMGVKMVLSGEGADEVFGGYLYFHKAPNEVEFHRETVRKISALHSYDCLRANKATAAWGVEARVPFLDIDFLEVAMNIDPSEKLIRDGKMEKHILRKAFDTPENPYLPHEVLWRQKEQFSDGVGYGWIDGLRDFANTQVTDSMLASAQHRFPHNTPETKEAYLYRSMFESHFPSQSAAETVPGGKSVACSTPAALEWDAKFKLLADPSGRAVKDVHLTPLGV